MTFPSPADDSTSRKALIVASLALVSSLAIAAVFSSGFGMNPKVQFRRGLAHATGLDQDDAEAVSWFRKAAERGYADAQYNLGKMYEAGRCGLAKDDAQAVAWYQKAAVQGDANAQSGLGAMYASGQGIQQDDAEAVTWLRKAADQGQANAQYYLGMMYSKGRGVGQDYQQAQYWIGKAAEQGNPRAKVIVEAVAAAARKSAGASQ